MNEIWLEIFAVFCLWTTELCFDCWIM